MVRLDDTGTPNFADDLRKIFILSFASFRKAVLYSGSLPDSYDNWKLAKSFAQAHGMVPIELTEGGQYLSIPDRKIELKYNRYELGRIWDRASIKYCFNIEGSVKTLVCGAWDESTFRRKEIHAMMKSHSIEDINGREHSDYVRLYRRALTRLNEEATLPRDQRHKRAINHIFMALAIAEIKQDLAEAKANDNLAEIPAILARVGHLRDQQHRDMNSRARPLDEQKLTKQLVVQEEIATANPGLHWTLSMAR